MKTYKEELRKLGTKSKGKENKSEYCKKGQGENKYNVKDARKEVERQKNADWDHRMKPDICKNCEGCDEGKMEKNASWVP